MDRVEPGSIHDDGAFGELDAAPLFVAEEDVAPDEADDGSPPPPRGTAEPTVSPFDGRDAGSLSRGRPRSSCAHADERLNVNAAAASPTENLWNFIISSSEKPALQKSNGPAR
jgi:hypothetical protein